MSYKIDLHIHTCSTAHAYSTFEECVNRAISKKMEVIAITNHGPKAADSPHWWSLKNMKVFPKEVDGLKILKGVEANIMDENGNIDINDKIYQVLDIVLAGFHTIEEYGDKKDIKKNTKALLNLFDKQYVDILTHPGNPDFPIDMYEVVKSAKRHHIAMEMNNSSFFQSRIGSDQNCEKMLQICKEVGCYISLGSDSHISYDIGNFNYVEKLIDKYNFPQDHIINSSQDILFKFLQERHDLKKRYFESDIEYI